MNHKRIPSKTSNRDSVVLLNIIFGDKQDRARAMREYLKLEELGPIEGDARISKIIQLATTLRKEETVKEMQAMLEKRQRGRIESVSQALRDRNEEPEIGALGQPA